MNRFFDLILALLPVIMLISLAVRIISIDTILYCSNGIGRINKIFKILKSGTMRTDTPAVATNLLTDPDRYLTPIGAFLLKYSLDKLPQLLSIFTGKMSFVGPRPDLFNQDALIALRAEKGVHILTPGLTGWAQVNGRDELPIPVKVDFDEYYLLNHSLLFDVKILALTALKAIRREGVKH